MIQFQVKVLSFSGCKLVQTSNGTVHVSFDTIQAIPTISLPCVNGLLRVMDGPVILDLLPSAMGVVLPSETSSSTRVGGVFADIVLAVINTLNISKMPYVMTRTWLEILIVFILKVCALVSSRWSFLDDIGRSMISRALHFVISRPPLLKPLSD
jgi:hypothetical protein